MGISPHISSSMSDGIESRSLTILPYPDVGINEWCAFVGDFLVPIFILISAYDLSSSLDLESNS